VTQTGLPPRRADWTFATIFLLLGVLEGLTEIGSHPTGWIEVAASVCAAAGVPWRRVSRPYPLVLSALAFSLTSALTDDPEFGLTGGAFLALVFLLYAVVRWRPESDIRFALPIVLIAEPLGALARTGVASDLVARLTLWTLVAAAALVMRYRFVLQQNTMDQVRLTERNILARELHDSVAHHVSGIAVQAQAAQYIARNDPEAAIEAMAEIEATANRAIDEMRKMVGVLRTSDDIARTVAPTSLLELQDHTIHPGVRVTGHPDLSDLSPPIAAAAYRVAQESVTNARKHARNASFINVDCALTEDEVVLQIVNDGVSGQYDGDGYGLVGMEERVLAVGGHLTAGPTPHRGWSVVARLPRDRLSPP
jgi:signal transduction histidine kinase